jgi:hypothetical protein
VLFWGFFVYVLTICRREPTLPITIRQLVIGIYAENHVHCASIVRIEDQKAHRPRVAVLGEEAVRRISG